MQELRKRQDQLQGQQGPPPGQQNPRPRPNPARRVQPTQGLQDFTPRGTPAPEYNEDGPPPDYDIPLNVLPSPANVARTSGSSSFSSARVLATPGPNTSGVQTRAQSAAQATNSPVEVPGQTQRASGAVPDSSDRQTAQSVSDNIPRPDIVARPASAPSSPAQLASQTRRRATRSRANTMNDQGI